MSRLHCSTTQAHIKAGRPHTLTQTAGFIHRLDKLCRRSHQLLPVSYPFTVCLHWCPDYSEQVAVKGTAAARWRSVMRNADTQTGVRHQTAKALSFQNTVLKLKLGLTPLTPKTKQSAWLQPSSEFYTLYFAHWSLTLTVGSKTGSLYRKGNTSSMAQNNVHLFIHHQWCNTAANMPLHTWHEIQHEH